MTAKLILVGCGNMGHAMLLGWLDSGRLRPEEVLVVEPNTDLRERARATGVAVSAEVPAGETPPGILLFAVKPQVMREVAGAYRDLRGPDTTIVSIAAGTRIAVFEEIFGADAAVIRCMPNTPAAIGKGLMALVANERAAGPSVAQVAALLEANGVVQVLDDEALMDAVTAVSGSGPAYVFHFIEVLRDAGIAAGLPHEAAALLAMQTVYGAACLAKDSAEEPGILRQRVTSPNGTTAAALDVLMGGERLKKLVEEAVSAARLRSIELG